MDSLVAHGIHSAYWLSVQQLHMSAKDNYVCIIMAAGVLSRDFAEFIASAGEDYTPPKTIDQQDVLAVRAVCVHACACAFLFVSVCRLAKSS